MRVGIEKGWNLKPADAIHLATADHFEVSQFHTHDLALQKYEEVTETHFPISGSRTGPAQQRSRDSGLPRGASE